MLYLRLPSSSPVGIHSGYRHEANGLMGETQGMVMAALDTVFATRRAATQGPVSTPSTAASTGLQTRRAARAAALKKSLASAGQGT